jgi:hypothetical protein
MPSWNETGGTLPFGPKPNTPAINWREPLTRGLVFAVDYSYAFGGGNGAASRPDLTRNSIGTLGATTVPSNGPFGQQATFPTGGGGNDTYVTGSVVNGSQQGTLEFVAKPNVNDFGCFFNKGADTAAGNFFNVGWVTGNTFVDVGFSGGGAEWQTTDGSFPNDQFCHCVVAYDGGSTANVPIIYINGRARPIQTNTGATGSRTPDSAVLNVGDYFSGGQDMYPDIVYMRYWNRLLTAQEISSLAGNPWQIYRQPPPATAVNATSGTTHSSTGALTGPGTTIAGTATRFRAHPSTGALTGPGSSVAGTAVRFRAHPSSGALTGPGSVIAGTAARSGSPVTHPSSGALVGPGASISGQAARQSRIDPGWPLVEGIRKRRKKRDEEIDAAWAQRNVERQHLKDQIRQAMQGPQPQQPAAKIETPRPAMARKIRDSEDDDIEILLLYA